METKFTKETWQVVDNYDNYLPYSPDTPQIYVWDGDEQASCPICDMGEIGDMNYTEVLAKAKLIAAAPDLLEALQLFVSDHAVGYTVMTENMINKAKQAISKALD